jgi:RNA polymerase sigma-70 factor (ECF subfamily)
MQRPPTRSDWLAVRQACLREALRILRDREDAEEAAQEALLRVWRHRAASRSESWSAWVTTIARNEALRVAERRRRFALREVHAEVERPDPASGPELDCVIDSVFLGGLLRTLREDERDLIRLRYERDLTNGQIARQLGMPEGTVKVRLHRLMHRLRAGFDQGEIA